MKKYKVMAYVLSSGLWDAFGCVKLRDLLGYPDEELERDLAEWQSLYDRQFKRCPYSFDWEQFNLTGQSLTERIRRKLPPDTEIYYEPSDDREFFSSAECCQSDEPDEGCLNELALRERKRTLIHLGIADRDWDRT